MRFALAVSFVLSGAAIAGELPATDAPPKPAPSACDKFGEGFAALVGTDTCVKIGGRIRADYLSSTFKTQGAVVTWPGRASPSITTSPHGRNGFRTSGEIVLDSRTSTELGTLRTYVEVHSHGSKEPFSGQ